MDPIIEYYATADGLTTHDYRFHFCEMGDGSWRAYILRQPGYCGRPDDAHSTHRLTDTHGRYICWSKPVWSLEDIRDVAAAWADATQKYRRTGVKF